MNGKGYLIGGGLLAGGGLLYWNVIRPLSHFGKVMDYTVDIQTSFDNSGMKLTVNIVLKNPSSTTLSFIQPYVRISGKKDPDTERGEFQASQQGISNKEITLTPFQATALEPYIFNIGWGQLPSLIEEKFNEVRRNKQLTIWVWMATAVSIGDKIQDFSIKQPNITRLPSYVSNLLGVPLGNLGLASGARAIKPMPSHILAKVPKPSGREEIVDRNADTYRTIHYMAEEFIPTYAWQTAKIAPYFQGRDLNDTCRNIWQFMYDHIQYTRDGQEKLDQGKTPDEELRTPRHLLYDPERGGDCDCTTDLAATILYNLGIPFIIAKAKYHAGWQHVYTIVPKRQDLTIESRDDYYVIDHVVNAYDYEVKPSDRYELTVINPNS